MHARARDTVYIAAASNLAEPSGIGILSTTILILWRGYMAGRPRVTTGPGAWDGSELIMHPLCATHQVLLTLRALLHVHLIAQLLACCRHAPEGTPEKCFLWRRRRQCSSVCSADQLIPRNRTAQEAMIASGSWHD